MPKVLGHNPVKTIRYTRPDEHNYIQIPESLKTNLEIAKNVKDCT